MEKGNATQFVLSMEIIKKMVEFIDTQESKFISVDPMFWTEDKFYLFKTMNITAWLGTVNDSYDQQILMSLSEGKTEIVNWFINRYIKSQS